MLGANHGGGYLYSVCPKSQPLTEKCLQGHSLDFVGSNHTISYLDGRPSLQIPARDVSEGTFPTGSTWRLNPIPARGCATEHGGAIPHSPMRRSRTHTNVVHTMRAFLISSRGDHAPRGHAPPPRPRRLHLAPQACNCDKGFACSTSAEAHNCSTEDERCSTAAYFNGSSPEPKGFPCPTGTQFPVPFDYGYGQQVWNLVPGPKTGKARPTRP